MRGRERGTGRRRRPVSLARLRGQGRGEGHTFGRCGAHSITSSAIASSVGGISRPMALAVL